jgi:hypothetical protein
LQIEQLLLQVEGGDILRRVQSTLDDYAIKDGSVITVEVVEKIPSSQSARARKPGKEEPKVPLVYGIREAQSLEGDEEAKMRRG